jgi:hypothetical protein
MFGDYERDKLWDLAQGTPRVFHPGLDPQPKFVSASEHQLPQLGGDPRNNGSNPPFLPD